MSSMIKDGTGSGKMAKVNADGRLYVQAKTIPNFVNISDEKGDAHYFSSDFIPLTTTGSFSAVFYLKNTDESKHLHIAQLRTCGTAIQQWELIFNPTTGSLIADGVSARSNNLNLGSSKVADVSIFSGGDLKTVTGGTTAAQWINGGGHSTTNFDGALILNRDESIALRVKPTAAGDFCVTILGAYETPENV